MKILRLSFVLLMLLVLVGAKKGTSKRTTTPKPSYPPPACQEGDLNICSNVDVQSNKCQCKPEGTTQTLNCAQQQLKIANICLDFESNHLNITSIEVNMSGNHIKWIDNAMMKSFAHFVSSLDLSNNSILAIDEDTFENFINLGTLDLKKNHIETLSAYTFVGLQNLETLDLADNRIKDIRHDVFSHLTNLGRLVLDGNPLQIDRKTFSSLRNLHTLSMDNCSLENLDPSWFKHLSNLTHLSLANNKFLVVPNFEAFPRLKYLSLSGNNFSHIEDRQFEHLTTLTELRLEKMPKLWAIESCGFCGLNQLETLVISNNSELREIEELAFGKDSNLKYLKKVDFSNNNLTQLHEATLPWSNISELHLDGNPWKCDCGMKWITSAQIKLFSLAYCNEPNSLRNASLKDLSDSNLACPKSLTLQAKSRRFRGRMFAGMVALLSVAGLMSIIWFLCYGKYDCQPPWKAPRGPLYAYRNLAMKTEDEPTGCGKEDQPIIPPTSNTDRHTVPDPVAV